MRRSEFSQLQIGDWISLKHNLGEGEIIRIALSEKAKGTPMIGKYPMAQFQDRVAGGQGWATYQAIDTWRLAEN